MKILKVPDLFNRKDPKVFGMSIHPHRLEIVITKSRMNMD
jgi:hypothetical protein